MKTIDTLLGLAVGDALGVPVEFMSRGEIAKNPVTGMRSFGTHQQPAGTWSDDSSMAFCLAEMLCQGYDLAILGRYFVRWYDKALWTAHDEVFDIGNATIRAINRLRSGSSPLASGNTDENSNGNGSLMRIIPLIFYIKNMDIKERYRITTEVSAVTHAHFYSTFSCFIFNEFALQLLAGKEKMQAYQAMQQSVNDFAKQENITTETQLKFFSRILQSPSILGFEEHEIYSSGYVLHTLEAAIWCFLKYDNYADICLKAVNMGEDTDTTGCVAGGLAGLYYGAAQIPAAWLDVLAKKEQIINLGERLAKKTADFV